MVIHFSLFPTLLKVKQNSTRFYQKFLVISRGKISEKIYIKKTAEAVEKYNKKIDDNNS